MLISFFCLPASCQYPENIKKTVDSRSVIFQYLIKEYISKKQKYTVNLKESTESLIPLAHSTATSFLETNLFQFNNEING